jgi:hypothetical protein
MCSLTKAENSEKTSTLADGPELIEDELLFEGQAADTAVDLGQHQEAPHYWGNNQTFNSISQIKVWQI